MSVKVLHLTRLGLYTPLTLASTTNILFVGDVDISTLARPGISGILAGLVVMVCSSQCNWEND